MSGTQDQPPDPALDREAVLKAETEKLVGIAATLQNRADALQGVADTLSFGITGVREVLDTQRERLKVLNTDVLPALEIIKLSLGNLEGQIDKLRGVMLGKIDGLQGTTDLVRQDVRNSWQTADFAISNSRNVRDDVEQIQTLISTMQRQYQLLASQVEVLRKNADEKE